MLITFPSAHRWLKTLPQDPFSGFGTNNTKKIKNSIPKLSEAGINYSIKPLSEEIIAWFEPWYADTIGSKHNPKISSIYDTTIGKSSAYPYFALIVTQDTKVVATTIFSKRKTLLSIAYRIANQNWVGAPVVASPSLIAEFATQEYALNENLTVISHGKDRNPYGINANIGLALFKLSVGCEPYLPLGDFETDTINTNSLTSDILIFALPDSGTKITQGYLCANPDVIEKYSAFQKYSEKITITVLPR